MKVIINVIFCIVPVTYFSNFARGGVGRNVGWASVGALGYLLYVKQKKKHPIFTQQYRWREHFAR